MKPCGLVVGVILPLMIACGGGSVGGDAASAVDAASAGDAASAAAPSSRRLLLATTTSVDNAGLLDLIVPPFEEESGIDLEVVAVGTGRALDLGRSGDVDMLLVHAPAAEEGFMAEGYGSRRELVFWNTFVITGPPSDPAGVGSSGTLAEALGRIREEGLFVSRGDSSGTSLKEAELWRMAGTPPPAGTRRIESGQGMGATLTMASELGAYTLTDIGTYLAHRGELDLEILFEDDPALVNPYHAIMLDPTRHPHINSEGAALFMEYLLSDEARGIASNMVDGGIHLFNPPPIRRGESGG